MKVRVAIRLKDAILDPQGKTVQMALEQLGYREVRGVRIGKLIELEIEGSDASEARQRAEEYSRKLLANPLMETFDIEIVGGDDGKQ